MVQRTTGQKRLKTYGFQTRLPLVRLRCKPEFIRSESAIQCTRISWGRFARKVLRSMACRIVAKPEALTLVRAHPRPPLSDKSLEVLLDREVITTVHILLEYHLYLMDVHLYVR